MIVVISLQMTSVGKNTPFYKLSCISLVYEGTAICSGRNPTEFAYASTYSVISKSAQTGYRQVNNVFSHKYWRTLDCDPIPFRSQVWCTQPLSQLGILSKI
jgi:hypothetical protein